MSGMSQERTCLGHRERWKERFKSTLTHILPLPFPASHLWDCPISLVHTSQNIMSKHQQFLAAQPIRYFQRYQKKKKKKGVPRHALPQHSWRYDACSCCPDVTAHVSAPIPWGPVLGATIKSSGSKKNVGCSWQHPERTHHCQHLLCQVRSYPICTVGFVYVFGFLFGLFFLFLGGDDGRVQSKYFCETAVRKKGAEVRFFMRKDSGLDISTKNNVEKKLPWNPEAKHYNKRQTVQHQAIFSPIKSVITVFLIYLMREMISLATCDHKVRAVTPAMRLSQEGAAQPWPPALPSHRMVTRCSVTGTCCSADPAASPCRTAGSPGPCEQLEDDRQLVGTYQQHAVMYFPFLVCFSPFPKCGFKMRNQCDQDLPWIKQTRELRHPERVCRGKGQNMVGVVLLTGQLRT